MHAPSMTPAHSCREATDGTDTDSRLASGSLMGYTTTAPITCYFFEPLRYGHEPLVRSTTVVGRPSPRPDAQGPRWSCGP